eukprot:m51a1_g10036 hypothetical protein (189) ;mRNA; r:12016-14356
MCCCSCIAKASLFVCLFVALGAAGCGIYSVVENTPWYQYKFEANSTTVKGTITINSGKNDFKNSMHELYKLIQACGIAAILACGVQAVLCILVLLFKKKLDHCSLPAKLAIIAAGCVATGLFIVAFAYHTAHHVSAFRDEFCSGSSMKDSPCSSYLGEAQNGKFYWHPDTLNMSMARNEDLVALSRAI